MTEKEENKQQPLSSFDILNSTREQLEIEFERIRSHGENLISSVQAAETLSTLRKIGLGGGRHGEYVECTFRALSEIANQTETLDYNFILMKEISKEWDHLQGLRNLFIPEPKDTKGKTSGRHTDNIK